MQAAFDPRSRSRLQPRLQPMHSGRPPLRPCTVPAKTSFPPRHTHVNVSITRRSLAGSATPRSGGGLVLFVSKIDPDKGNSYRDTKKERSHEISASKIQ